MNLFAGLLNSIGNLLQGVGKMAGGTLAFLWGNLLVLAVLGGGYYLYTTRQNNSRRGVKKAS